MGLYDLRRLRGLPPLLQNILVAAVVNWIVGTTYFYFFYPYVGMTPKTNFVLVLLLAHLATIVWRRAGLSLMRSPALRQRVAFVGRDARTGELARELTRHPQLGFTPVDLRTGRFDLLVADGRWVEKHWRKASELIGNAVRRRVPVMDMASYYESVFGKVTPEHAGNPNWMLSAVLTSWDPFYALFKRVFDPLAAMTLLVVLSPVLTMVWCLVRCVDGSPVLYRQRRLGFMGREFVLLKFRTMAPGSDSRRPFSARARARKRPTAVGRFLRRFRFDELPQLWNVVRGDMALVGPRPEWHREVEVLEGKIPQYHLRHLVRPGITGWAQLNFRATSSPREALEKLHYDLFYVKNVSLALDFSILLRTVRRILIRDGRGGTRGKVGLRGPIRAGRRFLEFRSFIGRSPR